MESHTKHSILCKLEPTFLLDQDGYDAARSKVQDKGGRVHGVSKTVQHPGQAINWTTCFCFLGEAGLEQL